MIENKEEIAIEGYNNEKDNIVNAQQEVDISVPVSVKPRVKIKDAILHCCGDPILEQKSCQCECCRESFSNLVLSENICLEIQIEFAADVIVKDAYIDCN